MRRLLFLFINAIIVSALSVHAQSVPSNADAKRFWNIAQLYIEENSSELAIEELMKVVHNERFAPAYIKIIELCYKLGDEKHVDIAEEYSKDFMLLWPDRTDEMKDIIALGEARIKLRREKFYDSLIGDWHSPSVKMGESYACFKVRRNENGGIYSVIPKEMSFDFDWVLEWQDGKFLRWEGKDGVYIYEAQYATYDGYRVKIPGESGTYWFYVLLYIPFEQPTLSEGKIKAIISVKCSGPNNHHWSSSPSEIEMIKD